jgi:hypothetical protein
MNYPNDPRLPHIVNLRITFGEGDNEQEVVAATMYAETPEVQLSIAQAVIALLSSGAEQVSVSDTAGTPVYFDDKRIVRPTDPRTLITPQEVN